MKGSFRDPVTFNPSQPQQRTTMHGWADRSKTTISVDRSNTPLQVSRFFDYVLPTRDSHTNDATTLRFPGSGLDTSSPRYPAVGTATVFLCGRVVLSYLSRHGHRIWIAFMQYALWCLHHSRAVGTRFLQHLRSSLPEIRAEASVTWSSQKGSKTRRQTVVLTVPNTYRTGRRSLVDPIRTDHTRRQAEAEIKPLISCSYCTWFTPITVTLHELLYAFTLHHMHADDDKYVHVKAFTSIEAGGQPPISEASTSHSPKRS